MPFEIVRNDITNMRVDAIVNSANPYPIIGSGTDSSIHRKAGPELLAARKEIGGIRPGQAAITPAFNLDAKYVIHTVGPVWSGGNSGEEQMLRNCYDHSLDLALQHNCRSIAFPLISSGNYGFPKDNALQIAIAAFSAFLLEQDMTIYLVVFDETSFKLSEKLFQNVASYIDQHYVDNHEQAHFRASTCLPPSRRHLRPGSVTFRSKRCAPAPTEIPMPMESPMSVDAVKGFSLEDQLAKLDAGFTETLLKLIDGSGRKDSEIYKKAGLSKQHFSKIRSNPQYKPTKATALSLALALELDLEQTNDLIGRAGYTLTNSSKFDLIIRFYIEQREYNIVKINCTLFDYDQSLLGS